MVGDTPKQLESNRCEGVTTKTKLESEISQYLLLHHDYFAKPDPTIKSSAQQTRIRRKSQITKRSATNRDKLNRKMKFKEILPKVEKIEPVIVNIKPEIIIDNLDSDMVYGTYNENTNCIVIVNDDNLRLDEAVTEVTTSEPSLTNVDNNYLQTPTSDYSRDSCSPAPSSGYESIGSPNGSEMDIWDGCVTELFPSLI